MKEARKHLPNTGAEKSIGATRLADSAGNHQRMVVNYAATSLRLFIKGFA